MWRKGHLLRFAHYVQDTQVELKKCTWPTFGELKGSTTVVLVSTVLIGAFTVLVDFLVTLVLKFLRT
ncbi:MAG: preprotein translocase subunit SecE [Verrucomicrobia bacterium]|nr:preprotein translocase subunit SecE [Verrucomicrobiota bacterium]